MPSWTPWWRRVGRASGSEEAPWFVTWHLAPRQPRLAAAERSVVTSVLRHDHGVRCVLLAFVVMDDHVHLLVRPRDLPLERLTDGWRRRSSQLLRQLHRRRGLVWDPCTDVRRLETAEAVREHLIYIVGNPWKRWPFVKGYPWVWEDGMT